MLFYIITILLGIILDFIPKSSTSDTCRKIYVVWLYIFLCFGYTTGSDWRNYEIEFDYLYGIQSLKWGSEIGFNTLFYLCKVTFKDFWLSVAILKGFYLYTTIKLAEKLTPYWLSVIAFLVTGSLKFMLIDNPLRFMTALVLVNIAMMFCLDKKYTLGLVLTFVSFFFHNASLFFVFMIPFMIYAKRIVKSRKIVLIILYLVVSFISTNVFVIDTMRRLMVMTARYVSSGVGYYSSYEVTSNDAFFTVGNFITIAFFFIVVFTRDFIIEKYENGAFVYGMTMIYMFLSKLFLIIPTGFRLAIPFSIFYMLYFVYLIRCKHTLRWVFILYLCFSFPRDLWTTYKYIPYTNSIPYIVTGHKPYTERYIYNIDAYQERTGKAYNTIF